MTPRDDLMIDIETVGTGIDCVIVSIGAVMFNRADAPGTYKEVFDVKIDVENQPGRVVEAGAMLWWMKDSMTDARKAAFAPSNRLRLGLALKQLDDLIKEHRPAKVWACGPNFDCEILNHAYKQHRQEFPVKFWDWSCVRTIEEFFYGTNTRKPGRANWLEGTAHDALDDCKMQVNVIQNCYQAAVNVAVG